MNHLENAFKGKNRKLRYYILILAIVFIGGQVLSGIAVGILALATIVQTGDAFEDTLMAIATGNATKYGISLNTTLAILLSSFLISFLIFKTVVKSIQGKKVTEIINGRNRVRTNRLLWGAGIWVIMLTVSTVIDATILSPQDYKLQFEISKFIPLFFIALLLIPIQSGMEELIFRGYLPQAIALKGGNRFLVVIIPSALFALMHSSNPEVTQFGFLPSMINYLVPGLIFGIVSVLDDGIETAMGAHIANNFICCILVTHDSSALQTNAIYLLDVNSINITQSIIMEIVAGTIFIAILYKKFNWNFKTFNKKVERPIEVIPTDRDCSENNTI